MMGALTGPLVEHSNAIWSLQIGAKLRDFKTVGLPFLHRSLCVGNPGPVLWQMMDCVREVPLAPMVSLSVPSSLALSSLFPFSPSY